MKAKDVLIFDANEEDDVGLNSFIKRAIWSNSKSIGASLNELTRKPKQRPARSDDDDDDDAAAPDDDDDTAAPAD
eukprot:911675-Prymnesium_polylepis.1